MHDTYCDCVTVHIRWGNSNIDVIILHKFAHSSSLLADDVAMELKWNYEIFRDGNKSLIKNKVKLKFTSYDLL